MVNGYFMNVFALKCVVGLVAGLSVFAIRAEASQVFPEGTSDGSSLQSILDEIVVGESKVEVDDYIPDALDSLWSIDGDEGVATLIIELAGFKNENIFGIYDYRSDNNTLSYIPLFPGRAGELDKAVVSINQDGGVVVTYMNYVEWFGKWSWVFVDEKRYDSAGFTGNSFGFYLDSSAHQAGGIAYSDTTLNKDGKDHMVAYQGQDQYLDLGCWGPKFWSSSEYLLAFEDLFSGSVDWDYEDMVVLVSSIMPIPPTPAPEPATITLIGAGCAGLGWRLRRRKRKADR